MTRKPRKEKAELPGPRRAVGYWVRVCAKGGREHHPLDGMVGRADWATPQAS